MVNQLQTEQAGDLVLTPGSMKMEMVVQTDPIPLPVARSYGRPVWACERTLPLAAPVNEPMT